MVRACTSGCTGIAGLVVTLLPLFSRSTFVALEPENYRKHFIEGWPGPHDDGAGVGVINQSSYTWATENLPLFDSSNRELTAAYYYRAKSYKSHLIQTDWVDIKHVVSEFGPSVPWGGVYGTINAAAGHHIREGRWLRERSFMDGLVRFWVGSQVGGGPGGVGESGAFEPGVGHFANGSRGEVGSTPYSSWILSSAVDVAKVRGDWKLGTDLHGHLVTFGDLLPMMVEWWEVRTLQLRTDCILANGDHPSDPSQRNRTCLDTPPQTADFRKAGEEHESVRLVPYCYTMADGWDAMEGSVSGDGCRPTIGAMMYSEALAIAAVANSTGVNASVAARFTQRAEWIREWYLNHLWSEESEWLGVYKQGATVRDGMGGCTQATTENQTDPGCCCIEAGSPEERDTSGHYANFSRCPEGPIWPHPSPGNNTVCRSLDSLQTCSVQVDGVACRKHSSRWPCGKAVTVRELLGLGPAYYFQITPSATAEEKAHTKYDIMWHRLFDAEDGFWGEYGPTTVERSSTCFNYSEDMRECNWAGPSWPYETSRVLTGLSNFLASGAYPPSQAAAAGIDASHYTRLLVTYAHSMTAGFATNGSTPWVGENIEPDAGYWIAHSIQYRGGDGTIDPKHPWLPAKENPNVLPVNCSACEGTCWDRSWAHAADGPDAGGRKCLPMKNNISFAKSIGPCDPGCDCVPPASSYNYLTHSTVACCKWTGTLPDGTPANCNGKRLPTADKDRGKDYNHSTFLDLIIEGLVGIRAALAALGNFLVVQPLADESAGVAHFALDNLWYHGRNVSVIWDPYGAAYPRANCSGLCVFVDGVVKAASPKATRLRVQL